jgi:hypothetical protein
MFVCNRCVTLSSCYLPWSQTANDTVLIVSLPIYKFLHRTDTHKNPPLTHTLVVHSVSCLFLSLQLTNTFMATHNLEHAPHALFLSLIKATWSGYKLKWIGGNEKTLFFCKSLIQFKEINQISRVQIKTSDWKTIKDKLS